MLSSPTFPEIISGLKGWGGWSLFFLAVIWWIRGMPERKRAETDAASALHQDYGAHIDRLEADNETLRERLRTVEADFQSHRKECQKETDDLREIVREMKKRIDGLERDIAQHSQSSAMLLDRGKDKA